MAPELERHRLPSARRDRLFFGQVREDPSLEIEALRAGPDETVAVVSSGGCTALSLLGCGVGRVVGIDCNPAQNDLVELKAGALATLPRADAIPFLGGWPQANRERAAVYLHLRPKISASAYRFWDGHPAAIRRGVLRSGVTERFLAHALSVLRWTTHPKARATRLLRADTLAAQKRLYHREWNNRRWRLFFQVLANRAVLRCTYHEAFFHHVENPSFPRHFHARVEHAMTEIPIRSNYFLHQMLTGFYPADGCGELPPYLDPVGAASVARSLDRLVLVDGSFTEALRQRAADSVHGFALSNICEWLNAKQIEDLFEEILRTAVPGARLVFRNFLGWTEVPIRFRRVVIEDRRAGECLMRGERSAMQRRFAVCRIEKGNA